MRLKLAVLAMLVGATLFIAGPAWATLLDYEFADCSQIVSPPGFATSCTLAGGNIDNGPTMTYRVGGVDVPAAGFDKPSGTHDLHVKNLGADETGLGLKETADFEVDSTNFIQLNATNLVSHGATSAEVSIQSLQGVETGQVCLGSTGGTFGSTACKSLTGGGSGSVTLTGLNSTNHFIDLTATAGNVLLHDLKAEITEKKKVPEPASMVLLGTGLMGLALMHRRLWF